MKISIRMPLLFGRQAQDIEGNARLAVSGTSLSTRLALAMVSLVVVTTAVLSLMTYHFVTEAAIPRSLDRLATKAMLCATKLETALNVARQDVMVVQGSTGVIQTGERDYFKRTIGQSKSDVYVSPVALEKDGGRDGLAAPTLHVAIPLLT